jgi:CubicO group peptidase (beta-lactamase class C family)
LTSARIDRIESIKKGHRISNVSQITVGGNPMRTLENKGLVKIIVVFLGVAIGLYAFARSSTSFTEVQGKDDTSKLAVNQNDIPIQSAITHVHEPDSSSITVIDIVIGNEFAGTLPDDIDTITVTGPNEDLTLAKDDFNYYPQFRDFGIRIPGTPETGIYTFTVSSGNRSGSATDAQSDLRTLPIPDIRTFSPAAGETITTIPPHFSWRAVDADVPLYYRIDIKDMQDNYIFRTAYVKDMFSTRIPPNILKAGQTYRWRVRVADGANWIELNNRSHNQWQKITVAQKLREQEYKYRVPVEIDDGWQTSSLNEEGVDAEKINELMQRILNGHDKVKNVHSVLLVKNSKLALEEYFYGTHRNHMHPIQSDTKSVISILMGIAVDKGFIKKVDQPILDFFPEITPAKFNADKRAITIEHLLMMAPGLQCRDSSRYGWRGLSEMRQSADWTQFMLDLPMAEAPGTRFEYCNGASFLLSAIIQKATGIPTLEFAEKHLFRQLGIPDLRWPANPQGITIGWGEMRLKPRDMAKIGYMMLKGGNWQGKQIVTPNWVNESTQTHIKARGYEYGYQWWRGKTIVNNQMIDAFWAWGHGGQFIFVLPALDLVVVFTAKPYENPGYSERAFNMMTKYIIPAVMPPGPPREIAKVDVKVLETYVGTYTFKHNGETEIVDIFLKDNRLYGRGDDEDIVELYPETENQFFGTAKDIGGFKLKFVKDQKGDVTKFVLDFAPQYALMKIPFDKIK